MTDSAESLALLTCAEMARADAAAAAGGATVEQLMDAAGAAVARAVKAWFERRPVVVLCGPGNNGGDGLVAARYLLAAGWPVRVALLGERAAYTGAAGVHAALWTGPTEPLGTESLNGAGLVIDALFGAGLSRPLEGLALQIVEAIPAHKLACVAIDVPSGVAGDTGAVLGGAAQAQLTVTFFRHKPGHLLLPGRDLCGETVVADIGIGESVLQAIAPQTQANGPALWSFPWPATGGHKYARGHALIVGGEHMTGAARLAARAALRVGAGLVTVASAPVALPMYAADLAAVLTAPLERPHDFVRLLADPRRNAVLIGPGNGVSMATQLRALAALSAGKACVLDADAISCFADDPHALFGAIRSSCLLTPHEGEFARLFPAIAAANPGDKLARARAAAKFSGATVLLKGADTVIAEPGGRAVINANAPPELATAGAGDVLAGLAVGLLAQGQSPFDAACAAAWLHGEAGRFVGPGLIADDLPAALPQLLRQLKSQSK
jgi:NAD(P)H-hydrate epimerase